MVGAFAKINGRYLNSQRALQQYYCQTTVANYRAKFHVFCCFCTFDSDDPEKAKIKLVDGVLS